MGGGGRLTAPPVVVQLTDGRVLYEARPKQCELHAAEEPYILYGGAAGGMKSHALRWHAIMACLKYPNFRALFLRRQSTELETTHLLKLRTELPESLATLNGKGFLNFHSNGSVIKFGHCNTDSDFGSHLSAEWDMILIDEGGQFTAYMLAMFPSRLRTTKPIRTQLLIASNPGGPGHQYLKEHFMEKIVRDDSAREYKPEEWRFIPAKATDNPFLDDAYLAKLRALPAQERAMYLDGSWDLPYGNLFAELTVGVHLVHAGGIKTVNPAWRHTVSADWGKSSSAPALWWETDEGVDAPAQTRCYQEWVPNEVPPAVWAQGVIDRSARAPDGRLLLEKVVLDAAAFDAGQGFGPTVAEQMYPTFQRYKVRLLESVKGPGSVRSGVELLRSWFHTYDGQVRPAMVIDEDCPRLWSDLVTIQRGDPSRGQDSKGPAPNQHQLHTFDAARYHVQGRPAPAVISTETVARLDTAIANTAKDPLSQIAIWKNRAAEAAKAGKPIPPRAPAPPKNRRRNPW